jgi:hypothetical protein
MNRRSVITALSSFALTPVALSEPDLPVLTVECSQEIWNQLFADAHKSGTTTVDGVLHRVKWKRVDNLPRNIIAVTNRKTIR